MTRFEEGGAEMSAEVFAAMRADSMDDRGARARR
jgi:hypothetical protein